MIIQRETKATAKKWAKRTCGFLSIPPRRPAGWLYIPIAKYSKQPRCRAFRLSSSGKRVSTIAYDSGQVGKSYHPQRRESTELELGC